MNRSLGIKYVADKGQRERRQDRVGVQSHEDGSNDEAKTASGIFTVVGEVSMNGKRPHGRSVCLYDRCPLIDRVKQSLWSVRQTLPGLN